MECQEFFGDFWALEDWKKYGIHGRFEHGGMTGNGHLVGHCLFGLASHSFSARIPLGGRKCFSASFSGFRR